MEAKHLQNTATTCLLIITIATVMTAFYFLKSVLIPFTIAVFIYLMLAPGVRFFIQKLRFPKSAAILLSIITGTAVFTGVNFLLLFSITRFTKNFAEYESKVNQLFINVQQFLGSISWWPSMQKEWFSFSQAIGFAQLFSIRFLDFTGSLFLVFIFLIFFLMTSYKDKSVFTEVEKNISKYIWLKILLSLMTALLVGAYFNIVGLELAITFAVLVFLLNFIPSIGSTIATLIPIPVAYLQFNFSILFWLTLLIPGVIQFSIGSILEPKLMGARLNIHPIAILFFLVFWGIVWGIPGLFLAVPITAAIKIIASKNKSLNPISALLEGDLDRVFERKPAH